MNCTEVSVLQRQKAKRLYLKLLLGESIKLKHINICSPEIISLLILFFLITGILLLATKDYFVKFACLFLHGGVSGVIIIARKWVSDWISKASTGVSAMVQQWPHQASARLAPRHARKDNA